MTETITTNEIREAKQRAVAEIAAQRIVRVKEIVQEHGHRFVRTRLFIAVEPIGDGKWSVIELNHANCMRIVAGIPVQVTKFNPEDASVFALTVSAEDASFNG